MAKKKGKPVSFDAMVKFFMQTYDIPTKRDVERLMARIDRLEAVIRTGSGKSPRRKAAGGEKTPRKKGPASAADIVLEIIRDQHNGADFALIRESTGYDDKKLRNIIYRLSKSGKISRINRGIYTAVP